MQGFRFSSLRVRFFFIVLVSILPAVALTLFAALESNQVFLRNLIAIGLMLLSAFAIAWIGSGLLLGRLNILLQATRRLAVGDTNVRIGSAHEASEMGQLADAFDEMAAALEQRTQQLAQREEYFRSLIENIFDTTLLLNADATIRYVSPSVTPMLGYAPDALIGDRVFRFVHPDDLPRATTAFANRLEQPGMDPTPIEIRVRHRDESWRTVESVGNNLLNLPAVKGIVINLRDITVRKQAEQALGLQNAKLAALQMVSLGLTSTLALQDVLQRIAETAQALVESVHAHIYLYDPAQDTLTLGASHWAARALPLPLQPRRSGTTYTVARTGQAAFIQDASAAPAYAHQPADRRPGALACLPLKKGDVVLGTLNLGYWKPTQFDAETRAFLELMASQAAIAIQNARLYEAAKRDAAELADRVEHLALLNEISRGVTTLDLQRIQQTALEKIAAHFGASQAAIALFDPVKASATVTAIEPADDPGRGLTFRLADSPSFAAAVRQREPIVWEDNPADTSDRPLLAYLRSRQIRSLVVAPLVVKDQVLGLIVVQLNERKLEPQELSLLQTMANQVATAIENAGLFDNLQHANQELALAYDTTLEGWSRALDLRDRETEGHCERVTNLTVRLGRVMGLPDAELVQVRRGALLHDIGKMGIPDAILLKPDALTPAEWTVMRRHPTYAFELLSPIAFLRPALDIPYCHHEKWDGTGYPRGLKGEEIPLAARLFAVVDVWDALRSDRPYRAGWQEERVREHIRALAGSHFDAGVASTFLEQIVS